MRRRGLLLGALLLTLVGGGIAFWVSRGERAEDPAAPTRRVEPECSTERPVLVAGPRPESAPVKGPVEPPRVENEEAAEQARPTVSLRLVDGNGEPLAYRRVTITAASATVDASTDREGFITFEALAGIQKIQVFGAANSTLFLVEGVAAAERIAEGKLAIEEVRLVVRTVDRFGNVRPDQRFLYRLAGEESGFWGETTDKQGVSRLGPFRSGTSVDLRPGPRGERDLFTKIDWRTVVADGSTVDLVVGDMPRLRLRVHGLAADEAVPVAVLDPEDGGRLFPNAPLKGAEVWTAPALAVPRVEVFVGPTADGRFARLRQVLPADDPIEVELERGVAIAGRVTAVGLRTPLRGTVRVRGRGFEVQPALAEDGSFRIPGVPDETVSLAVEATSEDGTAYVGETERRDEREITIPVRRAVRLSGELLVTDEKGTPALGQSISWVSIQPNSANMPERPALDAYSSGSFNFILPPGTWSLTAYARTNKGLVVGWLDLGEVEKSREDLVIFVTPVK